MLATPGVIPIAKDSKFEMKVWLIISCKAWSAPCIQLSSLKPALVPSRSNIAPAILVNYPYQDQILSPWKLDRLGVEIICAHVMGGLVHMGSWSIPIICNRKYPDKHQYKRIEDIILQIRTIEKNPIETFQRAVSCFVRRNSSWISNKCLNEWS
jgi:hypothetical protein